uniref:3',5'-cyclic-GMP phosphodiesterase n=1 Tax=Sander lucioperca TaxID=283035 RepID=A0A8C9YRW4_SANLU
MNLDLAKPAASSRASLPRGASLGRTCNLFFPLSFGEEISGMEGLGTDITVICPWEAYSHLELHELAQYGII